MREPIDLEPLFPDRSSGEAIGAQLIRRLRAAIETGFFPAASRLLPSRELASRLGVSRNTITSALDQLTAEGYLEARVGAGTFVTSSLRVVRARADPGEPVASLGKFEAAARALEGVGSSVGPLRVGSPDLSEFPLRTWHGLERKSSLAQANLDYGDANGQLELREAISRHIAQFRGVVADPDQIVVVEGTQGALHLIAFALGRPGQAVVVEDPCYQYASALFAAHGLELRGVPVDRDGLRTHELPRTAALAYVSPSHQFPLGGVMPLARRMALLEWAQRSDAYIVEDDYDSEFAAHPFPALQSLDSEGRVVYVGTFSKTLAPGLRAGYVVAPRRLAAAFRIARSITGRGLSGSLQQTIADFIREGHFSRYIRRMATTYARRRGILLDVLAKTLPAGFSIGPAQTGLHLAVIGPPDFDDVSVANGLPSGNRVLPLSLLCVQRRDCRGVVVGFSDGTDENVAEMAKVLSAALRAQVECTKVSSQRNP